MSLLKTPIAVVLSALAFASNADTFYVATPSAGAQQVDAGNPVKGSSLALGRVALGSSASGAVSFSATKPTSFAEAQVSPEDLFAIDSTTCGAVLPAGGSCEVNVTLRPVVEGGVSGTVTLVGTKNAEAQISASVYEPYNLIPSDLGSPAAASRVSLQLNSLLIHPDVNPLATGAIWSSTKLPPGLSLSGGGLLSGTVTGEGTFTVTVKKVAFNATKTASQTYTINLNFEPLVGMKYVAAGGTYGCGANDKDVYCWGNYSALNGAIPNNGNSAYAVKVMTLSDATITGLTASQFPCVTTSSNEMLCWGRSFTGVQKVVPPDGSHFVSYESKYSDTQCGITGLGNLYCKGQLMFLPGTPTEASFRLIGQNVAKHSSYYRDMFFVTKGGGLMHVGSGDLNYPSGGAWESTPKVYQGLVDGSGVTDVLNSSRLTCFVAHGVAKCAGFSNSSYNLPGTASNSTMFNPVVGGEANVSKLMGESQSCLQKTDGTALCWGAASVKLPVALPMKVKKLSSSNGPGALACAITLDDKLKCWGFGSYNGVGDGLSTTADTAKEIVTTHMTP